MPAVVLALVLCVVGVAAPASLAAAPASRPGRPAKPAPAATPDQQLQREADRHFQSGVALYRSASYAEALAEFQRAYDLAPHPLVLYNIAECHRELLHYAEAIAAYRKFLVDGKPVAPAARLATAQSELASLLTLVARATVTVSPARDDVVLSIDGAPLASPEMPVILPPGEHRFAARATGRRDAERTLKLAAGDSLAVELVLDPLPEAPPIAAAVQRVAPQPAPADARWVAVDAGFGMNLRRLGNTGAPSLGLAAAIGSRLAVGVSVVLVAYAVIPAVRVRLVGDALSLHVVAAAPIAFPDEPMASRFVSAAGGLAVRYRAAPSLAFRLESYVSFAGASHPTAAPLFVGGELWF